VFTCVRLQIALYDANAALRWVSVKSYTSFSLSLRVLFIAVGWMARRTSGSHKSLELTIFKHLLLQDPAKELANRRSWN